MLACIVLGVAACGGDGADAGGGDSTHINHKAAKTPKAGPSREEQTAGMVLAAAALRSADVADLKFDIATRPQAGLPFNVDLALLPTTESPNVSLELSGSDGLTLGAEDAGASFTDVSRSHVYRKSVVASADAEGVYFLTVVATFKNADFTDSRSFTIPIIVEPAKAGGKGAGASMARTAGQPAAQAAPVADKAGAQASSKVAAGKPGSPK